MNIDVISAVKERRLTGVTVETTTVRQYSTTAAAHLLGHVGDIQSSNWDYYREQGYSMNDKVGIDGAENAFEEYLRGESGVQIQELSTSGKVVSEYWRIDPETGEEQIPKPGDNVLLTLDLRLQEKVEEILPTPSRLWSRRIPGAARWWWRVSRRGRSCDGLLSHLRSVPDLQQHRPL